MGFLLTIFNTMSLIPVIPFGLVYFLAVRWGKDRKQAVKLAMDVTTLFLLFSVSALFNHTFQSRFGFYLILLVLLIAVGLIGSAQTRWKGKVDARRLVRVVWRLAFVAMSFCYVVFTFFGLITYIIRVMYA